MSLNFFKSPIVKTVASYASKSYSKPTQTFFKNNGVMGYMKNDIHFGYNFNTINYPSIRYFSTGEQAAETQQEKEEKVDFSNEDKAFDAFLEDDTPENKKKIHALWLQMEKDLEAKEKKVKELQETIDAVDKKNLEQREKLQTLRSRIQEEIEERELASKRAQKEIDNAKSFSIGKFAQDLLDVVDNFERALESAKELEGKGDNLFDGVEATKHILLKVFAKHGINPIDPLKEKFDPNFHEALFDFPDPNQEPGTCGVVCSKGYMIQERVLRPAKVGIVKDTQ